MRLLSESYNRFLDYIKDKYYDDFWKASKSHIIKYREELILNPNDLDRVSDIEVEDLDFKFVNIQNTKSEFGIRFDVVVAPEVSFSYYDYRYRDWDNKSYRTTWLRITCIGILGENDLEKFKVVDIEDYSRKQYKNSMDGDLVPYFSKEDYDTVAEEFLLKYYPEALSEDKPIDVEKLVTNMGLKLLYRTITEDCSIFGESFFSKTGVEFFNYQSGKTYKEVVDENTIVIDPLAHALFSFGSNAITVIHECLHFYLHKKAFRFARIYNKNLKYISCSTSGVMKNIAGSDKSRWMEIEANGIAPHVLLTKNKLISLYHYYKDFESSVDGSFEIYLPKVIRDIAERLGVSVYSVKKRLLEIGIKEVAGCLDYVDGHYVPTYSFKDGSLNNNESYTISEKDLISSFSNDTRLLMALASGDYCFVENHLVFKDEKYIKINEDGDYELTKEARFHLDECAIKFSIESDNSIFKDDKSSFVTFCYLCRDNLFADLKFKTRLLQEPNLSKNKELKDKYDEASKYLKQRLGGCLTIGECIDVLLEEKKESQNWLSLATGIDKNTLNSYYKETTKPSIQKVMAIAIAFHLPPEHSNIMIKLVGDYPNNVEGSWYIYLMTTKYHLTVIRANKFLEDLGYKPLTNLHTEIVNNG